MRTGFAQGTDDSTQVATREEAFTNLSPFLLDTNRRDQHACSISSTSGYNCTPPESCKSNYLRCARPADHVGGVSSTAETAFIQTLLSQKPPLVIVR